MHRESVASWREAVPLVASLRNPDMRERHWAAIEQRLGRTLAHDDTLTLALLMELRVRTRTATFRTG